MAGMPHKIIEPYFRWLETMTSAFQVGKILGEPRHDRTSIPQGCPFSMMMVALLMTPWVNIMKDNGLEPRVLADDLLFTADDNNGEDHLDLTIKGVELSIDYFEDIGAKVAANKCFTFASSSKTRNHLKKHIWKRGNKIINKNSFRDLGSHLHLHKSKNGATLSERMLQATKMTKRLRWLNVSVETKHKIITTNIIPAALYGVEATYVNQNVLNGLRSAIATIIGSRSAKRSVDLTFDYIPTKRELDPNAHILLRRVIELRRNCSKNPGRKNYIKMIMRRKKQEQEGKFNFKEEEDIRRWKQNSRDNNLDDKGAVGPITLLCAQLESMGYKMDDNLIITHPNETPIDIWHMPIQHLKAAVLNIAKRARATNAAKHRTYFECAEIDHNMIKEICGKFQQKEINIFRHIATGGMWSEEQLETIQMSNGKCKHCGLNATNSLHTLWDCPKINSHKKVKAEKISNFENIPKSILQGIPEAMTWRLDEPFWGKIEPKIPITKQQAGYKDLTGTMEVAEAANKSAIIEYNLNNRSINVDLNARQIFAKLKEVTYANVSLEIPYKCTRNAPDEINVYTDGSLLHNKKIFYRHWRRWRMVARKAC